MPHPTEARTRAPRWRKPIVVVLLFAIVGALVWSQLPRGAYPTDLSSVGTGRPALVLAFDMNYSGGAAAMELMNVIRSDYAQRVDFLVAHLGLAEGQAFAERYRAGDGTVLLFAGNGDLVDRLHHPRGVEELRQALDAAFSR
ncbi:MAG: hypothetical protein MUE86_03675 [Thiobacillaceae bacterium]|jgi:hypothetical protein|nr:hypothetical protein [Thiobacillaceae bacterium]